MRHHSSQRIVTDLGGSSQIHGPRGGSEVGSLLVSTFYTVPLGERGRRSPSERDRGQRGPRA